MSICRAPLRDHPSQRVILNSDFLRLALWRKKKTPGDPEVFCVCRFLYASLCLFQQISMHAPVKSHVMG